MNQQKNKRLENIVESWDDVLKHSRKKISQGSPDYFENGVTSLIPEMNVPETYVALIKKIKQYSNLISEDNPVLLRKIIELIPDSDVKEVLESSDEILTDEFIGGLENNYLVDASGRKNVSHNYNLLNAVLFMDAIRYYEDRQEFIDEDSLYNPYTLFPSEKKTSIKDVEALISQKISKYFTPRMNEVLDTIDDMIDISHQRNASLGKYASPECAWKDGASEEKLDEVFNQEGVRREYFETLARCVSIIGKEVKKYGINPNSLKHFKIARTKYPRLMSAIQNHGMNLTALKYNHSEEPEVKENVFTELARVEPSVGEGNVFKDGSEYIQFKGERGCSSYYKKDGKFFNTTKDLPFIGSYLLKCRNAVKDLSE